MVVLVGGISRTPDGNSEGYDRESQREEGVGNPTSPLPLVLLLWVSPPAPLTRLALNHCHGATDKCHFTVDSLP